MSSTRTRGSNLTFDLWKSSKQGQSRKGLRRELSSTLLPIKTLLQATVTTPCQQILPPPCMMLKAIHAGAGWVWLARLHGKIVCYFTRYDVPLSITPFRAGLPSSPIFIPIAYYMCVHGRYRYNCSNLCCYEKEAGLAHSLVVHAEIQHWRFLNFHFRVFASQLCLFMCYSKSMSQMTSNS